MKIYDYSLSSKALLKHGWPKEFEGSLKSTTASSEIIDPLTRMRLLLTYSRPYEKIHAIIIAKRSLAASQSPFVE